MSGHDPPFMHEGAELTQAPHHQLALGLGSTEAEPEAKVWAPDLLRERFSS